MTLFETETMAELCARQGQIGEALAIYRRLVADAPDVATRQRRAARLAELEAGTRAPTLTMAAVPRDDGPATPSLGGAPSLTLDRRGGALTFAWMLPPETEAPALQLLLVTRGADGVETETRTLRLRTTRGMMTVTAGAVISVRAAVGRLDGERFVPMARLPDGPPATL